MSICSFLNAFILTLELFHLQAKDQVMLRLDAGKQIAQESLRILIRLEELLQLHVKYDQSVSLFYGIVLRYHFCYLSIKS